VEVEIFHGKFAIFNGRVFPSPDLEPLDKGEKAELAGLLEWPGPLMSRFEA
jgi:hypothetical protein